MKHQGEYKSNEGEVDSQISLDGQDVEEQPEEENSSIVLSEESLDDNLEDSEDPTDWPEYLLEINPNIADDKNYELKLNIVSNNEEETYSCSLADSVVELVSDEVFQFQAVGEEPFLNVTSLPVEAISGPSPALVNNAATTAEPVETDATSPPPQIAATAVSPETKTALAKKVVP
eukprot:gene41874-51899_t